MLNSTSWLILLKSQIQSMDLLAGICVYGFAECVNLSIPLPADYVIVATQIQILDTYVSM